METRNCYFTLTSDKNSNELGLRPSTNKLQRFNVVVPQFKLHKIWFPVEMKKELEMVEMLDEIRLAAVNGFKSKHDDFIDTISMLGLMNPWKPSHVSPKVADDDKIWEEWAPEEEGNNLETYLV